MTNVYKDYNDFCLWGDYLNMYLFNSEMQYFLRSKEKKMMFSYLQMEIFQKYFK